jgi:hypothetical protein
MAFGVEILVGARPEHLQRSRIPVLRFVHPWLASLQRQRARPPKARDPGSGYSA